MLRGLVGAPRRRAGGGTTSFRPEIQALRAVAVALVVVFHVWPRALPGGYVGVDIFFVISGFLITSHLLGEVARTGTIRLSSFWARRIRRLLPAAFVVLAVCLALVWFVLPSSTKQEGLTEIGASALYVENWVLAANSVDYLAASNVPSIVQHFWSLSAEEQFYLIWPIAIIASILIARSLRRGRSTGRRAAPSLNPIALALGAIVLASFVCSVVLTAQGQPSAYFSTFTRAWEFGVGGLLAMIPARSVDRLGERVVRTARSLAGWLGLGAIAIAAAFFSNTTPFPGYWAAIPVLGAAFIIWAGRQPRTWGPSAVAGFRPLQFLGDVSYSTYLWHWPIIITYEYLAGRSLGFVSGTLAIAGSVLLAWLTKIFVEDPVRTRRAWVGRRSVAYGFAAAGMAIVFGLSSTGVAVLASAHNAQAQAFQRSIEHAGAGGCIGAAAGANQALCSHPFALPASMDTGFAKTDKFRGACTAPFVGTAIAKCDFGSTASPIGRIAVLGDSHAAALLPAIGQISKADSISFSTYIKAGCPGVDLVPQSTRHDARLAGFCADWTRNVTHAIASNPGYDAVLIHYASNGRDYYSAITPSDLRATIGRFTAAGKKVILVLDSPGNNHVNVPECLDASKSPGRCTRPRDATTAPSVRASAAVAGMPGVSVFALSPFFCDPITCHPVVGGLIAYFDSDHMTQSFALTLVPFLGPVIQTALVH